MIRKPAVAGAFYPADPQTLSEMVTGMVDELATKTEVVGFVSPHAGYVYSGQVAGAVISRVSLGDTCIMLGPNHTGLGKPFSLWSGDDWETPMGQVAIDETLRQELLSNSAYLAGDTDAHRHEHSLEVQLPFLQHFKPGIKIVPIILGSSTPDDYQSLGEELANVISASERHTTILVSSDMTHYESQSSAEHKDKLAIEAVLALNGEALVNRIAEFNITMCGYAPTLVLIAAAKKLGATTGELIRYQTSGDTSGNYQSVVGYAGIIIRRTT